MKRWIPPLVIFLCLLLPVSVLAEGDVAILSPRQGEGVKGRIEITGYIKASNYSGYEVDFADESNEVPGWYPISGGTKIGADGLLSIWDTTTISDGNYSIRLTVSLNDGSTSTDTVTGIRVRNYSPMEPVTPQADAEEIIAPTSLPTSLLPASQITSIPERNPAEISGTKYQLTVVLGGVFGIGLSVLLIIFFSRQKTRLD